VIERLFEKRLRWITSQGREARVTIYGPDISSYQAGLDLSRLADASFVIAKASEGTYYTDAAYQGWRRQATSLKRPFVWYHFLSSESVSAQVTHTKACVGDPTLPGMLDVEPTGTSKPTLQQVLDYADASKAAGLRLRLVYLPHWYWQELGSPSLSGLTARGLALISSSYPGGTGSATRLYPGDKASGWNSYGGVIPALYQYTNQAGDGGQALDYNAFRGTAEQFAALLAAAPTTTGGTAMAPTIPATIGQKWPEIAADFPANGTYDDETALIWADGGARAAALYAKEARDAINALAAKVQQPPPVDVKALATALAPLIQQGATADQIATAVVNHLGAKLATP
jgi:hypothetical protein